MRPIYIVALLFILPVSVSAVESIPSFDARITVNENATIEVSERIVYDFGEDERHGIFRIIPYSYQAQTETYTADISSVLVTDEFGNPRPFQESRGNGELNLKIGNPNAYVTGRQTYVITYIVEGPFLYFDDRDEFYWNVTGYWPRAMERASVLVDLPRGSSVIAAACYQGPDGAGTPCDESERLVNSERAGYQAAANMLGAQEGLTIAVAFPKGTIAEIEKPWAQERPVWLMYLPLALPLLAFFVMLYLWYTRGRDPKGKGTIVTQFTPPEGLTPGVAGTLYNEHIEPREISAEIVRLAVEGYIKIHRLDETVLLIIPTTDYLLERIGDKTPEDPVGSLLLDKLFQSEFEAEVEIDGNKVRGSMLSKMKHKFVKEKKAIEDRLYDEVVVRKYFLARPDKVRTRYIGIGIGVAVLSIGLVVVSSAGSVAAVAVAMGLTVPLIILGAYLMPAKTREGVRVKEYLEGFKRYLEVAEKDRLKFHNAPEKKPETFSAFLPYAMAFGVEKEWAEYFEDMQLEQPDWYSGTGGRFAATAFASDLSSFSSDFSAAAAPQSSGSGGGGSVGGGFGGGGGGSW